ncbi:MAG: HDOD domain-containing protein [Planctomycetes bacterium]|nr:HDOD domain-containing protein [Planctomycetota bacterium]
MNAIWRVPTGETGVNTHAAQAEDSSRTGEDAAVRPPTVFVARQPIFDRDKKVYGYELLFRSGLENYYNALDADKATVDVISNSFFVIGFDKLTDGKRAFINFTRNLLVRGVAGLLPREAVAIEILEDITPDDEIIAVCSQLKKAGYTVAMDDFVYKDRDNPLVRYADIVKVDFMGTAPEQRKALAKTLSARGVRVLAEKVETAEEFDQAVEWGYSYFQGYFFSKPVVHSGRRISANKLTYMQVLNKVHQPGISYEDLEALIKQDISLTYKLLRFMNSAWFGFRSEIRSVRHALILLGPKEIKKWFALIALTQMATDKPHELMLRAIARGKIAEGLAPLVGMQEHAPELFLLGMFSLIDALVDAPMEEILEKLPLDRQIKMALLGEPCPFRTVHEMILAYERADWDHFSKCAASLKAPEDVVPDLFRESLRWANEAFTVI